MRHLLKTQVLIIGGGATGTALARDLALRGVQCILVEKGDINSGASGANHGLLHSGCRYVSSDPEAARECQQESKILKGLAPHCMDDTGGLFLAVEGDDEHYAADFPARCAECGIPVESLDLREARELEPDLSERIFAAYQVQDAAIDPFRISLENMAQAGELGAKILQHTQVAGFKTAGRQIQAAFLKDLKRGDEFTLEPDQVVAACGAWVGEVAALAGINLPIIYSKGTLLITERKITRRVINRLRPPADGDILVPGGMVSILGTTSVRVHSLDETRPTVPETDLLVREGATIIPVLDTVRYIRAYSGVRSILTRNPRADDRLAGRGFTLLDHTQDGLENFLSILGGKLTTCRLMAEKAADWACNRMGISTPCRTRTLPLPDTRAGMWTEPALGPRYWLMSSRPDDPILCECEILPQGILDGVIRSIREGHDTPELTTISRRSRMGKGPCQGTCCGVRVMAHLVEKGVLKGDKGLGNLLRFLQERWKGERPVLWDGQIIQAELKEAIYCATGCLDLWGSDAHPATGSDETP